MAQSQSTPPRTDSALAAWWEMYRRAQESATDRRARVFVRSITPTLGEHETRQHRFERLDAATEAGYLDTYDVTVLGDEICVCDECKARAVNSSRAELVDVLRHWEYEGLESSGFTVRTVESSMTGETYRTLVPPAISFGIYLDDSLVGVFPCASDHETYSPEVFLDGLGRHRQPQHR